MLWPVTLGAYVEMCQSLAQLTVNSPRVDSEIIFSVLSQQYFLHYLASMSTQIPYIGVEEVTKDVRGTTKAFIAELLGTLLLVNINIKYFI